MVAVLLVITGIVRGARVLESHWFTQQKNAQKKINGGIKKKRKEEKKKKKRKENNEKD